MGKLKPLIDALKDSGDSLATHGRRMVDLPAGHKNKLDDIRHKTNDTDRAGANKADADVRKRSDGNKSSSSDELVPRPECLTPDGRIDWSQAPHGGYTLDADGNPIFDRYSPQAGEMFDRYGDNSGRYVSPLGDDGRFPYETRSLPYAQNENAYHQFQWTRDLTELPDAYDAADSATQDKVDAMLEKYDLTLADLVTVKRGEAAPAFGEPGGAIQHELPMSVSLLQSLGMVGPVG